MDDLIARFPGADPAKGWARFDGPAGTQMVDAAIDAVRDWSASGANANGGGYFAAAEATDARMLDTRAAVGALLGAPPDAVWFGPNMTTMTFAFTRALARDWKPGDRIVGTKLDHDANVSPWRLAAEDAGAELVLADFDRESGRLATEAVVDLIDERTRWVAVTGASNLLGTMPDIASITKAAHERGARVFVDAVHLAPHTRIDVGALGCDAVVTSSYKWYGPHAAAMYVEPDLLDAIRPYKVRPASDHGPKRLETGTPNLEGLAGVGAAARFLAEHVEAFAAYERGVFAPLLEGLQQIRGVRIVGPKDMAERTPTVSFRVDGTAPDEVAKALAEQRIATWSGDSYAREASEHLGISHDGAVVRAGVVRYVTPDDVQRLLRAVDALAGQ